MVQLKNVRILKPYIIHHTLLTFYTLFDVQDE